MTDQLKRAINEAKTAQTTGIPTDKAAAGSEEQHFDMSESTYKTSHTAVRKARRFAMQGLYEWLVTDRRFDTTGKLGWKDNAPHDIAARTRATNAMHTVHIGYYHEMMRDIPEQIEALDALIEQHLDRELDKLDTVEHAILLIGAYELQHRLEIPYKVVLDEAMKLNNHFGATDAHKLINAVLDRLAIELRALEVDADTKANKRHSQQAAKQPQTSAQAQTDNESTDANSQAADKPTASNKPRISANKTGVKRHKPSATATKQATQKRVTKPVAGEQNEQKSEVAAVATITDSDNEKNPITAANSAAQVTTQENSAVEAVEKDKLLEATDEADIGLENSNLLSAEEKVTATDNIKEQSFKDNSSENLSSKDLSAENLSTETKD